MARVKEVMIWIHCYFCGEQFQIRQKDYYRNMICGNCPKLKSAGK